MLQHWFKRRQMLASAALIAAAMTATGCFGRFPMTKALYQVNKNIGNSFEHDSNYRGICKSVVMWLLSPIYCFAMVGDVLILNLIEFWTGDTVDVTGNYQKDGMQWAWTKGDKPNEIELSISQDGKTVVERKFVKQSTTEMLVFDKQGVALGKMVRSKDQIEMFDNSGRAQGTLDVSTLTAQGI